MGHRAGRHRTRLRAGLFAAGLFAVVVGTGAVAAGCDGDAGRNALSLLEPVNTAGTSPFTPPLGSDQAGVTPPTNAGGAIPGNTMGLYGGAPNQSSCDAAAMVAFLQAHPDQAAAWAGVRGIAAGDIPGYVATLTPAILRSDTAVTNHGFDNGHATAVPAVLQAGTAVLVDKHGVPVTKCLCGNPLTAPTVEKPASYTGSPWPLFSIGTTTVVQPTTMEMNAFTLVEPATGVSFERPAGTQGKQDKQLTGPPSGQSATEASNASWVVGSCLAREGVLYATVLVRNNGSVETHSYEVTVSFGPPSSSYGQATTSFERMAPGQTREVGVSTASRVPDGRVPCEVTRIVDENGIRPARGGALPPPADRQPPPATSSPPTIPPATSPPVTSKPPTTPQATSPSTTSRPPMRSPTHSPTRSPARSPTKKPTMEPPVEPPTARPPAPRQTSIEPDFPLPTD